MMLNKNNQKKEKLKFLMRKRFFLQKIFIFPEKNPHHISDHIESYSTYFIKTFAHLHTRVSEKEKDCNILYSFNFTHLHTFTYKHHNNHLDAHMYELMMATSRQFNKLYLKR